MSNELTTTYDAADDVQMPAVTTPAKPAKSAGDWRTESIAHALDEAYRRASTLELTADEAKALGEDFADDAFRLGAGGDPDLVYIEHAYLRERLNDVLGVGASVPIRRREWSEQFQYTQYDEKTRRSVTRTGVRIYVDLVLVVRGCVVGEAIGDSVYYPHNPKTNYSDALESAKSNAFRRCAKEFGVGLQAWKKAWVDGWKERQNAAKQQARGQRQQQARPQQQQERPQQNFAPPPDWPNTTVDDLIAWIDTLQSSAAMKAACGLLFGDDTPLINMRERDPLIRHLHAHYHARLDGMSEEVKAKLADVTSTIDDTLAKHELDQESHEAFG